MAHKDAMGCRGNPVGQLRGEPSEQVNKLTRKEEEELRSERSSF